MINRKTLGRNCLATTAIGLFLVALVAGLMLNGSAASSAPQDMKGVWYGFIQSGADPPEPVRTDITSQTNRRFAGSVTGSDPLQPIAIDGTVSASGKVNFHGESSGVRSVGKTDLVDFGGGAAILNGSFTRFSNDGTFIIPCVLVLRPFAVVPPDTMQPAGRYAGNLNGEGTVGEIEFLLGSLSDPVRPTSLDGTVRIVIGTQTRNLALLGTMSADGRLIAIAHFPGAGHMIVDANLSNPPDPVQPSNLNGSFTVEFGDGSELQGTFQTVLTRTNPS